MSLIKCKECGKEVAETAITCPNCGAKVSNGHSKKENKIVVIVCICIALMCISLCVILLIVSGDNFTNKQDYATLAEFNEITYDMTYDDVVDIFGVEGTLDAETSLGDIVTSIYSFNGYSGIATITIQDGIVMNKVQVGLQ